MRFARGLTVLSLAFVSFPLAVACGSASSSGLFSSSGASALSIAGSDTGTAGADISGAGSSGADATVAGMSAGGAGAGEPGAGGRMTGNAGESAGGASNAGTSGMSMGGASQSGAPSAGAPSGGSAGSGGASAGAGGTTAGAGGTSAGAGGATAGSGGVSAGSGGTSGGAGSSSGGGAGCLNSAPTNGAGCTAVTPDSCFYQGIACSCLPTGNNPFPRKWGCYGTPGDKCSDPVMATGASCKMYSGGQCPMPGGGFCACVGTGDTAKWACQPNPVSCPTMKPQQFGINNQCATARTCAYADDQCFCNGANWTCESF